MFFFCNFGSKWETAPFIFHKFVGTQTSKNRIKPFTFSVRFILAVRWRVFELSQPRFSKLICFLVWERGGGSDSLIAEKRTTQGGHFISRVWRRILWGGLLKGRRQKATVTAQTDTRSHTIHKTRLMTKSRCPCKVACKKFHTNYSVIIKTCQWCCMQWSRMGCLRGTVVTPDKAAACRAQLMGKEGWRWDEMILSRRSIFSAAGGGTHGGKGTRRERREVRRKIVVLLLRKDLV